MKQPSKQLFIEPFANATHVVSIPLDNPRSFLRPPLKFFSIRFPDEFAQRLANTLTAQKAPQ